MIEHYYESKGRMAATLPRDAKTRNRESLQVKDGLGSFREMVREGG